MLDVRENGEENYSEGAREDRRALMGMGEMRGAKRFPSRLNAAMAIGLDLNRRNPSLGDGTVAQIDPIECLV